MSTTPLNPRVGGNVLTMVVALLAIAPLACSDSKSNSGAAKSTGGTLSKGGPTRSKGGRSKGGPTRERGRLGGDPSLGWGEHLSRLRRLRPHPAVSRMLLPVHLLLVMSSSRVP